MYWQLAAYFALNLALTFLNKAVLRQFPGPYLLTALHALAGTVGCHVLLRRGYFSLSRLSASQHWTLVAFSLLYTCNIALSNISLHQVSIPLHQLLRATSPVFVVLIYRIYYRKTYPTATYISLLPVVVGVGLATSGEYSSTRLGFTLTLLGSFSAAVKTIVTNRLQTGTLSLPTLELLYRIGPLAFVQSALAGWVSGELKGLREEVLRKWWSEGWRGTGKGLVLVAANAGTALALNIASFTTNRDAGALTMAVAANVKQVLAIVISVGLHEVRVGVVNVVGIILTLVGGIWYAKVGIQGKKPTSRLQETGSKDESLPMRVGDIKS